MTTNYEKTIFIASNSLDAPASRSIANVLESHDYPVLMYEADQVAAGRTELAARVGRVAGLIVEYDGRTLELPSIAAAWYRRPTSFGPEQKDSGRQLSMAAEFAATQRVLFDMIPDRAWLSTPKNLRAAETKLTQLVVARDLGFAIPDESLITNRWASIADSLPRDVIQKPAYGVFYANNKLGIAFTSRYTNEPESLPLNVSPYPGIWQPYVEKKREWRVTVVGDEVFAEMIETADEAKDDWRRHQNDPELIQFRRGELPVDVHERCKQYLKHFDLRYGAFDFIETPEGELVFLECNPNGQFGYGDNEDRGRPITHAIARLLMKIADESATGLQKPQH